MKKTNKFIIVLITLFLSSATLIGCGGGGGGGGSNSQNNNEGDNNNIDILGTAIGYITNDIQTMKIVIGDLNGDGLKDAVAISNQQHMLVYYQGTNGNFTQLNDILVSQYYKITGVDIGDVNYDGREDLAISGEKSVLIGSRGRIIIFYQDTNGTLQEPQEFTVSSVRVGDLCIADLNSDGRKDIAVLAEWTSDIKGNVSIFYQTNTGTLNSEIIYKELFVRFTGEIHAADMDNDGDNDLVFQNGNLQFVIVKQMADGTLSSSPDIYTVDTSNWPNFDAFELGDVTGDGKNDVVVVVPGTIGYFYIFPQNGSGTLDSPIKVNLMQNPPYGIELADINMDGLNEILGDIVNPDFSPDTGGEVRVYYQDTNHNFNASNYSSFIFPALSGGGSVYHQTLSVGDVTGDGYPDAVVTWSDEGLYVLPNTL